MEENLIDLSTIVDTEYEVWASIYNWDEQAEEMYPYSVCRSREAAKRVVEEAENNLPVSFYSYAFFIRKLARRKTDNSNRQK